MTDGMSGLSRAEFLYEVGELHARGAPKARRNMTADPAYANKQGTANDDTAVDMYASVDDEDEYWAEIEKLQQRRQHYLDQMRTRQEAADDRAPNG